MQNEPEIIASVKAWSPVLAAALTFLATYLGLRFKRKKDSADTAGDLQNRIIGRLDRVEERNTFLEDKHVELRTTIAEQGGKIIQLSHNLAQCELKHQDCEAKTAALANEVRALQEQIGG